MIQRTIVKFKDDVMGFLDKVTTELEVLGKKDGELKLKKLTLNHWGILLVDEWDRSALIETLHEIFHELYMMADDVLISHQTAVSEAAQINEAMRAVHGLSSILLCGTLDLLGDDLKRYWVDTAFSFVVKAV